MKGWWQRSNCSINKIPNIVATGLILSSIAVTSIAACLLAFKCVSLITQAILTDDYLRMMEVSIFYTLTFLLLFAILIYYIAEYGCFVRQREPAVAMSRLLQTIYGCRRDKSLLVLVPSFKEEQEVIRQTLLSAALAEYPGRRVVLLIDDPPTLGSASDRAALDASRRLPGELQALFDTPASRFDRERGAFQRRRHGQAVNRHEEGSRLAALYDEAAEWLEQLACDFVATRPLLSHTDRLFIDRILNAPAGSHRQHATELRALDLGIAQIDREYLRLATLCRVEFSSFERKRYRNLSHAPNKAMNLNSYLALVGGSFREMDRQDGLHLEPCNDASASLRVADAEYIAVLDADSLMTSDYALRLVSALERPGNERVAVAQTPYTAIPDAPIAIERTAAASTDALFFNHQGMALLGASFWVGASALIRRTALLDIAISREERGHKVPVYIDDTILIEDAAATVDLLRKGWRVHHDHARLAYSATPANFGALLIQRRRWANGGLLILPRLLGHALSRPWSLRKLGATLARMPNLTSAALAGVAVPILLLGHFEDDIVPLWMPLLAIPYYLVYGRNLRMAGFAWSDLARVYALNALLIPVNLGGTLQSLRQACTGRPIPFQRTPKVAGRTRTPAVYLLAIQAFCLYALIGSVVDGFAGRYLHMLYGLLNGVATGYGVVAFVGLAACRDDLRAWIETRCWRLPRLAQGALQPAGMDRLATATAQRRIGP